MENHLMSQMQFDPHKISLKSWKEDYLHRPDQPQGVTTWHTGIGNEWVIEPIEGGKVKLKSWKGDYLHRPDQPQGVTTWHTGIGNEWVVEPLSFKAQDIDQMVQAFSANFEQVLLGSDLNRDGWVSRAELMSVLLRANTPWQTADAIVTQIFQRVDTNRDGRIAIEDVRPQICSGTGGAVTTVLPHTTIPLGCIHSRSRPSYRKLFGHLGAINYLEWHLWEISKSMEGSEATQRDGVIPAGYTYFGQFIDHDLTSEASTFRQTPSDTSQLRNLRTPRFDLDNLYDNGPEQSPALYSDGMRLMFGNQDNPRGDLARDPQGKALIGDPRNDENVLVASMHLLFILLHNHFVDFEQQQHPGLPPRDIFNRARRRTTWYYQMTILNDFLPRIVGRSMVNDVWNNGPRFYRVNSLAETYIPLEFSGAAYRFGHSMVRERYNHNRNFPNASLKELFFGFPRGVLPRSITQIWTIDWNNFFDRVPGRPAQRASRIDTILSKELFNLPAEAVGETSLSPPNNWLAFRNLFRGNQYGLATGQSVAQAMGVPPLTIGGGGFLGQHTPLWYYILKEAELLENGERLGPVGGRIVAETFIGILKADPDSISHPQNWHEVTTLPPNQFTMAELIDVANPPVGP
jgi:hypothetical protein